MATVSKRKWTAPSGEVSEAWLLSFTDAAGKRHRKQFAKKRDADAERVRLEGQVAVGTFRADADKHTVADACDRYIRHLEERHGRDAHVTATYLATVRAELSYAVPRKLTEAQLGRRRRGVRFTHGIGHLKLAQTTSRTIADFRDRLLSAGVSVSTARRVLASLSRAFDLAREDDLVATNPARGVKVVGSRKDAPTKIVPPTRAQMRAILDKAPPALALRLRFAAATGLRASEQWALRWRHLDLVAGNVTVESRVDVHGVEDVTKSQAGRREVPLGKALTSALSGWREVAKHSDNDSLVFPNSRGGHTSHGNLYKRDYVPLLEKAKVDGFNWHSLRHYAVSEWIAAGMPPKTVQTFAGHATLAITMDRYGHLFPSEAHRAAMDSIADGLFA